MDQIVNLAMFTMDRTVTQSVTHTHTGLHARRAADYDVRVNAVVVASRRRKPRRDRRRQSASRQRHARAEHAKFRSAVASRCSRHRRRPRGFAKKYSRLLDFYRCKPSAHCNESRDCRQHTAQHLFLLNVLGQLLVFISDLAVPLF